MKRYLVNNIHSLDDIIRKIECAPTVGKKKLLNIGASFDTEATSFFDAGNGDEVALVYVWMFGIDDAVIYGRNLDEFRHMAYVLNGYLKNKGYRLIVYVHNLKYDFQFIRTYLQWDAVFMKDKRQPLYTRYGNIEFRDSLVLAGGRSLAYIGNHLKSHNVTKAVGELDYNRIRHTETPLTDEELDYCERDILVLNAYIAEKIAEDGSIEEIPYTNTGYVRRHVKNACLSQSGYRKMMDQLTLTAGAYQQCESAFVGGAVGANPNKIGAKVEQVVSYDIKSSYPYVMITQTFPMGFGIPVANKDAFSYLVKGEHHCIFRLHVHDLHPKADNDYCFPISQDKCVSLVGAHIVSNRVKSAASLAIDCTELDYDTFTKFYELDRSNAYITHMRAYPKGRLPAPIVKSIFEFFNKKTTLDGVKGSEAEYMISKNMLNAIFGNMVERPIRPKYLYIHNGFARDDIDYEEQIIAYNEKRDRVLFYPWGVYVTAWARHRLYDAIYAVGNRYVYCDTDSVKWKLMGEEYDKSRFDYFIRVNDEARNSICETARKLGLSLDYAIPMSPDGEPKVLGVWEREFVADNFKTLGPKRYLYDVGGEYHLTVAGTNKASTLEYILKVSQETGKSPYTIFTDNLVIPKKYAKRLIATYVDDEQIGYVTDYLGNLAFYDAPSGVHMQSAPYTFNLSKDIREELAGILGEDELDLGETYY